MPNNEPENLLPLCANHQIMDQHNPTARIDPAKWRNGLEIRFGCGRRSNTGKFDFIVLQQKPDNLCMLLIDDTRAVFVRRGRNLELLTIGWNSLEAIVAIVAGLVAGSIALIGFGLDSVIEVSSGVALLWRLSMDHDMARRERVEAMTLRIVGITFFALAAYVAFDSIKALVLREPPSASISGMILAALSLVVMPVLARAKRRVAAQIQSKALQADSRQTDICAYLSAILLVGLLLNALFGLWWADPVAALIMAPIIAKEGKEAVRGDTCCNSCH